LIGVNTRAARRPTVNCEFHDPPGLRSHSGMTSPEGINSEMREKTMRWTSHAVVVLTLSVGWGSAGAQQRGELGKREFQQNCVVCHGAAGKGDGSYGELLRQRVPDLTTLTRRNGGVFPFERVVQTIDGRGMPAAHGRDMPIWGDDYLVKAAEYYGPMAYNPEAFVQARILALVDHLNSLQQR
jgi:hypothetical protein